MLVLKALSRTKISIWMVIVMLGTLSFGFKSAGDKPLDLSTPQKSYIVFVDILKAGKVASLPMIATQTGQASLVALYKEVDYQEGMTVLGKELATVTPIWEEITEEIYFASAKVGNKVHKMEFTKEEPGWMLYHWQIGGGADAVGTDEPTEPEN